MFPYKENAFTGAENTNKDRPTKNTTTNNTIHSTKKAETLLLMPEVPK